MKCVCVRPLKKGKTSLLGFRLKQTEVPELLITAPVVKEGVELHFAVSSKLKHMRCSAFEA